MANITALEQRMIVNPFVQDSSQPLDKRSQRIEQVSQADDHVVMEALKLYSDGYYTMMHKLILTPSQIYHLQACILDTFKERRLEVDGTGECISKLIGMSNKHLKETKFNILTGDRLIWRLPQALKGVQCTIQGNAGIYAGTCLTDCLVYVTGDAGQYLGEFSKNSTFIVEGNVDSLCAEYAERGDFTIHGDTGLSLGYHTKDTKFLLYGDVGGKSLQSATGCTLSTPNKATYEKVKASADKGNTIQLIDAKGVLIEEVRL